MAEIWKPIRWIDGYSVSNTGRVRNDNTTKILSQSVRSHTSDYLSVTLPHGENGENKTRVNVHRLVAETFLERETPDLVVNHKDGNKHNNAAENLEWVTRSENDRHAFALGLRHSTSEQIAEAIKSRMRKVINITLGKEYDSICDAARDIGGQHSGISKCLSGERETYYGMKFAYSE